MNMPWGAPFHHKLFRHCALIAALVATGQTVSAAERPPGITLVTTLTVTSGAGAVTTVPAGTVVTLTATVNLGPESVKAGLVNFCDASASQCTDIHLLGTAALSSNGMASLLFVPGTGTHSYKAAFVQQGAGANSVSAVSTLTVGPAKNPVYSDIASIAESGYPGGYSLTATMVGYGGTAAPNGTVSFLDTSFGNTALGTASLGSSTPGLGWVTLQRAGVSAAPISEVTGDFNKDGLPDLAVLSGANGTATALTIFLGKGDGTFAAGVTTQTTIESTIDSPMIVADFNGDGKADLAILSCNQSLFGTVTTFLGNGDGTFAAPTSIVINQPSAGSDDIPGSLVAADFNGDGNIDLATAGDVNILLGNGDGTFTQTGTGLQPSLDFNLVASGDFNGDGIPDLVATQYLELGVAYIFLGKGDGTFTTTTTSLPSSIYITSIVVADFNQDGKSDLALGFEAEVEVFLGNGDGTFNQAPASALNDAGFYLVAGDFNHDGKTDLASANPGSDMINLFVGAGDGTFTLTSTTPVVSLGGSVPTAVASVDFNGDGVPDLALLVENQTTASILLTEPTESAIATVNSIAPVGTGTHNVTASYAGDANYSPTVSAPVALTAGLAPVQISLAEGTYTSAQTITLTETVPGATIYYSLAGTISTNGFVPYTAPIPVNLGGVEFLDAYATETGYQTSVYTSANYYLNLPGLTAPAFSPAAGSYPGAQTVTISSSVAGAAIYYTINGAAPTASSTKYTGPITIASSETVSAIAIASGNAISAPAVAQYLISSSRSSFIYTVAGNGSNGYSGDGGPATSAQLNHPTAAVMDTAGNLYLSDTTNAIVRKVAAGTGIITTFAGTGTRGYSGDNGPASSAQLNFPTGLALDNANNLYIADSENVVVRKVALATGVITTVAGNGTGGAAGSGGPATSAQLNGPMGLTIDGGGNLYIADFGSNRVLEVAAQSGVMTMIAGGGDTGYNGDGGPASAAGLSGPSAVVLDSAGNLYIADTYNNAIRKVTANTGIISTVAGTGYGAGIVSSKGGYTGDGGPATNAELYEPYGVTIDSIGNLYIADLMNHVVRVVAANSGIISTVAGNGSACSSLGGDGGPATAAALCHPQGLSVDGAGNIYVTDAQSSRIRELRMSVLPPAAQTAVPVFSIPGGEYGEPQTVTVSDSTAGAAIYITLDGSAPSTAGAGYMGPVSVSGGVTINAIAVAPGYVASAPVNATYTITSQPTAVIATVAGDGASGFLNSGGDPLSAQLGALTGVALDRSGNLFFADDRSSVVWKVSSKTGQISTVAGISNGFGPSLILPAGLATDSVGNLYVASTGYVLKVAADTGLVTAYAGNGSTPTNQNIGDYGPATSAYVYGPQGLAVDSAGNLYIADSGDDAIRMVAASTGIITTVARTGGTASSGNGGPATSPALFQPSALALDNTGNLYIAVPYFGLVLKLATSTGIITTVAGNGLIGSSGDGDSALQAEINPQALAVDAAGNLYISDPAEIREVSATTGIITRVAGTGYLGYSGDGGSATVANIANPQGLAFDGAGNLYLADQSNYRVRKVFTSASALAKPTMTITPSANSITAGQPLTVAVAVNGGAQSPTPTGSVTLVSGAYSAQQNLANGATTFNLAAGSLPSGANTLTATYRPDNASAGIYSESSQIGTVTVTNSVGAAAATVTLTPSATTITDQQAITIASTVTGATGQVTPTGNVTLTSGSYSSQQPLTSGGATFSVPSGALTAATTTLTASYSGDNNYASASGTTTIDVVPLMVTVPTAPAVAAGSTATATAALSAGSKYSGTLNLSCTLTASPAGAQSLPTCSLNPASVVIASGGKATTTVTINSTAASTTSPLRRWGSGSMLALGVLFLTPALRRRKAIMRSMVCGIAITAVIGCGGHTSASSGAASPTVQATSPGIYTFRVTATDASNAQLTTSTNLTITVE
jgi:sugar lactone lactonase YvrE